MALVQAMESGHVLNTGLRRVMSHVCRLCALMLIKAILGFVSWACFAGEVSAQALGVPVVEQGRLPRHQKAVSIVTAET